MGTLLGAWSSARQALPFVAAHDALQRCFRLAASSTSLALALSWLRLSDVHKLQSNHDICDA